MKMLNKKFVRTLSCAAVAVCAAAMLSVGAFAAEVDSTCVEGYLPPQEQMVQGDIALHSGDVAVGEKDPSYGGATPSRVCWASSCCTPPVRRTAC